MSGKRRTPILFCLLLLLLLCGCGAGGADSAVSSDQDQALLLEQGYLQTEADDTNYVLVLTDLETEAQANATVTATDLNDEEQVYTAVYLDGQSGYALQLEDGEYEVRMSCEGWEDTACYLKTDESSAYYLWFSVTPAEEENDLMDQAEDVVGRVWDFVGEMSEDAMKSLE